MTVYKVLKYLALVIGVIGLILLGRVLFAGDDAITNSGSVQASVIDPFLWLSYFVLAIIIVLVLFYVIKGLFQGDVKKSLTMIGLFGAVVLISYLLAGGGAIYDTNGTQVIGDAGSKWVDAGLIAFYILGTVAVLAMVLSGARNLFTKK